MTKRRHHILLSSAQSLSDELLRSKKSKPLDSVIAADDVLRPFPVKDLRSRRIFSPPKIDGGAIVELGFPIGDLKSSNCVDLGSDSNILCGMKEESNGPVSNGIGIGSDECVGKDSNSQNKLVAKTSLRRKVLKVPGSHSYNRLLPFLMDMAKDDTCSFTVSPCVSKIGKPGLSPQNSEAEDKDAHSDGLKALENEDMNKCGNEVSREAYNLNEITPSKAAENGPSSNGVIDSTVELGASKVDETAGANTKFSCLVNSSDPKGDDEGIYGLEPLANGNIENFSTLLPSEALDMSQLYLSGSEKAIELGNNAPKRNDEYTEECIQTTPPEVNMVETVEAPKIESLIENGHIAQGDTHEDMESEEMTLNCDDADNVQLNLYGFEESIQSENKDQKRNEICKSSNGVEEYNKEYTQTTPPDINVLSKPVTNMVENEESPKEKIDSIARGDVHKDMCLKNDSTFKKKGVLNPCSRMKVFKGPGSFSYRRLLPYLMEVSNDSPHNSTEYSLHPKIKTRPEERNPPTAATSKADSADNKFTLVSSEKTIELKKPFNSPNKSTFPVEKVISDVLKDLEHVFDGENSEINTSPARLSCHGDTETMHRENSQSKSSQGTKALKLEYLNQKLSSVGSSKGILRRNPRGCRGLCNCLDCTSFRLNADRAFEFSRNQMLDAEEVVLDLVKELSGLRNMLHESTVDTYGQVIADNNQVKAACTKALEAEKIATSRLKEMQSDLSAHCRRKILERPKVRFSDHNREMIIADVDFPVGDK